MKCHLNSDWLIPAMFLVRQGKECKTILEIFREGYSTTLLQNVVIPATRIATLED